MTKVEEIFKKMSGEEATTIVKQEYGYNNDVYLINNEYIFRIPKNHTKDENPYIVENDILKIIKPYKISEEIIKFDVFTGAKLSKKIEGYQKENGFTDEEIISVAKSLIMLHSSGERKHLPKYKPLMKYRFYKRHSGVKRIKKDRKLISNIRNAYHLKDKTLCHNDLVFGNIIFADSKAYFIDFEYAATNSIFFDLASFISENNLNEQQKDLFLSTYFTSVTTFLKEIVDDYCRFLDLFWYYWANFKYKKTKDSKYLIISDMKKKKII